MTNKINIPYRQITPEDAAVLTADKAEYRNRVILPFCIGALCIILAVLAPVITKSQGSSMTFIGVIILAFVLAAIICFRTGFMRIKTPTGICEVTILNKRKEEYNGAQADGETKIAHYFMLKINENGNEFESFVEDEEYAKANVGDIVYLLKTGKNSYRVAVK